MSQVRARIVSATCAAVVGGGIALGLLAAGGAASTVAGVNAVSPVTTVTSVTSAVLGGAGLGSSHTSGTSLG